MKQKTDWNWKICGFVAKAERRPLFTSLKIISIILMIYLLYKLW